jgi:hypothetical protein
VTLTEEAPRITWLFVSTSPDEVRTIPVPAEVSPLPKPSLVVTTTTPERGVLVAVTACAPLARPDKSAEPATIDDATTAAGTANPSNLLISTP